MKKQIILIVAATLVLSACGQSVEKAVTGKEIYTFCVSCHGAQGEKLALGVGAVLAGQSKDELIMKMKGYKDGSYGGAKKGKMVPKAVMLTDGQIKTVSAYIAKM